MWNRTDAVPERLRNFDVKLSTDNNWSSSSVISFHTPGQAPALLPIEVRKQKARYVRVQLRGTDALSLAEVQVWGKKV